MCDSQHPTKSFIQLRMDMLKQEMAPKDSDNSLVQLVKNNIKLYTCSNKVQIRNIIIHKLKIQKS